MQQWMITMQQCFTVLLRLHPRWVFLPFSPIMGSQIFEAIGISKEVIDRYFTNTVSRVGGITIKDIEKQIEALHNEAFDPLGLTTDLTLNSIGRHKSRSQGEEHRYNPADDSLITGINQTGQLCYV